MKPIKVEDQEIKSMALDIQRLQETMHYWTREYIRHRKEFVSKIGKKYPQTRKEGFSYNFETHMIFHYSEKDEEASV